MFNFIFYLILIFVFIRVMLSLLHLRIAEFNIYFFRVSSKCGINSFVFLILSFKKYIYFPLRLRIHMKIQVFSFIYLLLYKLSTYLKQYFKIFPFLCIFSLNKNQLIFYRQFYTVPIVIFISTSDFQRSFQIFILNIWHKSCQFNNVF